MRILFLALALSLVVSALFGPPSAARAEAAADLLPKDADLSAALAPLTLAKFQAGPGIDGWDSSAIFEIVGTPDGPVMASLDAAELPTNEGAAGFLQTKLQQLRTGAAQAGLLGDMKPADATITQDADEAYIAVYITPDGAPNRMLTAFVVARYDNYVTAVQTMMTWEGAGVVPQSAQTSVGGLLGVLAKQVNDFTADD